jgi:hypothetical protein
MEQKQIQNTEELLQNIQEEWTKLMKVVDSLTPGQMVIPDDGGWSPKDNLSHLAFWEHLMLEQYLGKKSRAEVFGVDADILKDLDENGENALVFERNRNRSLEDVTRELMDVHNQVISTLKELPFVHLLEPLPGDDPQQQPILAAVLGNTSGHYAEHRATLEKLLNQ